MIIPTAPFLTDRLLTELTAVSGPLEWVLTLNFLIRPGDIMRQLPQGLSLHSCFRAITPDLTYNAALPHLKRMTCRCLLA